MSLPRSFQDENATVDDSQTFNKKDCGKTKQRYKLAWFNENHIIAIFHKYWFIRLPKKPAKRWHFLSQWIFKILPSFRVYKNLTSSSRKFCWSTENKTARMKFWSWHRRFGHLYTLTLFKRKTSLKQLVIDWQFFSFDHRTLEWQTGRGGGRGQDATSQMYPFLSKRKKPVSTSRSLTTKYHKHLLQTLEGRVI